MATNLTKTQWIEILLNIELTKPIDLSIFQALYSFEGHKAYASQIGVILGYKGKSPHGQLNLEIGRYAKRIAKYYDIEFTERSNRKYKFWDLFFNGWDDRTHFVWQLKPDLVEALKQIKLTGEFQFADDLPTDDLKKLKVDDDSEAKSISDEELIKRIRKSDKIVSPKQVTRLDYERNEYVSEFAKRKAKGFCQLCENSAPFNDSKGKPYLESHHVIWLSRGGDDSVENVIALCPNCHRKMHELYIESDVEKLKRKAMENSKV